MTILDGPGFLRNTIIPSIGGSAASAKRIPFTFTSTQRLLKSGKLGTGSEFVRSQAEWDNKQQLAIIEQATRGPAVASQLGLSSYLSDFKSGQQAVVGIQMPVISMAVNPQSIGWAQPKRFTKRDTQDGSTFFHFTDSNDQNNDILTMNFSGKTGNINTNVNFVDMLKTNSNLKLRTWHELYNLSREPMLINYNTSQHNTPSGMKNEFFITYKTVLFPIQITLIGFFSKVLDFTETAEDPNNRSYSFEFIVTRTSPSLDDMAQLISTSLTTVGATQSLVSNITASSDSRMNAQGINTKDLING